MDINTTKFSKSFSDDIKSYLPWLAFTVLMGWNLYQMSIHAMWRDELHSWLISSTSNSFGDLVENTRWEGHPLVWYICLWVASFVSKNPITIKILHFTITFISSLLIMFKAPFTKMVRLMILAGYFFSFEYLVISRNYAIGVLIIILIASFYEVFIEKPICMAFVLGVLANTSIYGAIVSMALISGVTIDLAAIRGLRPDKKLIKYIFSAGIYFISMFVCYITVKRSILGLQVSDIGLTKAIPLIFQQRITNLYNSTISVLTSMIPIPAFKINFWNTFGINENCSNIVIIAVLIVLVALIYAALGNTIIGLSVFIICFVSIIFFNALFLPQAAELRHNGMLYICLISCAWLGRTVWRKPLERHKAATTSEKTALTIVLIINIIATIVAHYFHTLYPFSNGRAIAEIIKSPPYYNELPYTGYPDTSITAVTGYLNKPLYYPSPESDMQYYPKWGSRYRISQDEAISFAKRVSNSLHSNIFFISTRSIADKRMMLVSKTSGAIVSDEDFFLYIISPQAH